MLGNQEEERSVHFQGRKISKGMLIFVVADIWNCYNMDMKKANWNLWRKDKMDRPITTLFMLMSVDGKISTGATDDLDVDKDFPKIKGVNEGLHQYYEIEQTTDLWSFNSGRVQEKMGVNKKKIPRKTPVSFVVIDNKHLNENGIRYFCALSKEFVLITTNTRHPAFNVEDENLHIIYQNELSLKDYVDIIIAPVLIGGKDTSTLIDGKSLTEECELSKLGVVKLQECVVLENSYLRLRYEVIH